MLYVIECDGWYKKGLVWAGSPERGDKYATRDEAIEARQKIDAIPRGQPGYVKRDKRKRIRVIPYGPVQFAGHILTVAALFDDMTP